MYYDIYKHIYLRALKEYIRFIKIGQSHYELDFSIEISTNFLKILATKYIPQMQYLFRKRNTRTCKLIMW